MGILDDLGRRKPDEWRSGHYRRLHPGPAGLVGHNADVRAGPGSEGFISGPRGGLSGLRGHRFWDNVSRHSDFLEKPDGLPQLGLSNDVLQHAFSAVETFRMS